MIIHNIIADKEGKFEFQFPRVMDNRIEVICLGYFNHDADAKTPRDIGLLPYIIYS